MLTQHYLLIYIVLIFLGDCRFIMLQLLSLSKLIFIQIRVIHDNIWPMELMYHP